MPYALTWEGRGVYVRYHGACSDAEILRAAQETQADRRFDSLRWVINDFLGCTGFSYDPETTRLLAAINAAAAVSNPRIKVAIIVNNEEAKAMFLVYSDPNFSSFPTAVFDDVAAGAEWVGAAPVR